MTAEEGMLTSIGGGGVTGFGVRAGLRGSIIERSEGEEEGETQTETEEQEERDGKTENVVVCLRCVLSLMLCRREATKPTNE